jgi:hypothetical protein
VVRAEIAHGSVCVSKGSALGSPEEHIDDMDIQTKQTRERASRFSMTEYLGSMKVYIRVSDSSIFSGM